MSPRKAIPALLAVLLVVGGSASLAGAGVDKADICHWSEDEQTYIQISVAAVAAERHLSQHDADLAVGGAVTEECEQAVTVFARAYSVTPAGEEVLIAQLEDTNANGTPDGGDTLRTDQYPLDFSATSFGDFGVTEHVADAAYVSATNVQVASGDDLFQISAGEISQGYSERGLYKGGGRTFITDGATPLNSPILALDSISAAVGSPSQPSDSIGPQGRPGDQDDHFIEVELSLP